MPVDHNLSEIGPVVKKLFTDPQKIMFLLMRKRNPRAHPRVTEEIPADAQTDAQRGKKRHVRGRQRLFEGCGGCLVAAAAHQRSDIDAVGMQGFETSAA